MIIHPSIASSKSLNFEKTIAFIDDSFGYIHIDIEDGNYVPNITFGKSIYNMIVGATKSRISVHLMVNNPLDYLDFIVESKPEIVFIHIDHLRYPLYVINAYRQHGIEVGIALNPSAEFEETYYLDYKPRLLLMLSEPDNLNQNFREELMTKVSKYIDLGYDVWCDGGINSENIKKLAALGVNNVVMGRAIFE